MTIAYRDVSLEQVPIADTTLYQCPAGFSAVVIFGNCTNEDTTATSLTLNIIQAGGAIAVSNQYISNKIIISGGSDSLSEVVGVVLTAGQSISAIAADADRLNLKLSIKEISL